MSAQAGTRLGGGEMLYCHGCQNRWSRNREELICPNCHCVIVEIIEQPNDPIMNNPLPMPGNSDFFHQHPLHNHNPWANDFPDPPETDIDRVTYNPAPGIHIQRTLFRSTGSSWSGHRTSNMNDEFMGSFFQPFGQFPPRSGASGQSNLSPFPPTFPFSPPNRPSHSGRNPNNRQDSPFPGASRNTWTTEERVYPQNTNAGVNDPMMGVHAIIQTIFGQIPANQGAHPFDMFRNMLDPSNAVRGDAVFTQEAFDRVMSEFMQNGGGSTAPGPASEAAIAALPKKSVDKSMMGSDGKAECSVCMDNVEIGDQVTLLPCNHWFHEQCVTIWLKEHDTCPHCRKGISTSTSQPGTQPEQDSYGPPPYTATSPPESAPFTQPGMQHPYVPGGYPAYPEPQSFVEPPPRPSPRSARQDRRPNPWRERSGQSQSSSSRPRRRNSQTLSTSARSREDHHSGSSAGGGGSGGGLSGWFRNLGSGRHPDSSS